MKPTNRLKVFAELAITDIPSGTTYTFGAAYNPVALASYAGVMIEKDMTQLEISAGLFVLVLRPDKKEGE